MDAEDKANREAFEFIESLMAHAVLSRVGDRARAQRAEFQIFLQDFINNIWPLVYKIQALNLQAKPGFIAGPAWKPHTEKTRANKLAPDEHTFMHHWGDLRSQLKALADEPGRGVKDFGTPGGDAVVRDGSGKIYSQFKMDKLGRWQYAAGTRDQSGRAITGMVKKTLIQAIGLRASAGIDLKVIVDRMERIDAGWMARVIDTPFSVFNFGRRHGRRGGSQPARPFLIPFLDWYTSTHFEAEFKRRFN